MQIRTAARDDVPAILDLVRALAADEHIGPDGQPVRYSRETLDRWIRAWHTDGFEGLKPRTRAAGPVTPTAALTLAIMAARIPPGSLIACPGFTFVATPSAITLAGCRPFLVEVDADLHLDLDDLRRG